MVASTEILRLRDYRNLSFVLDKWVYSVDEYGEVLTLILGPVKFEIRNGSGLCTDRGNFEVYFMEHRNTDASTFVMINRENPRPMMRTDFSHTALPSKLYYFTLRVAIADIQNWCWRIGMVISSAANDRYPANPSADELKRLTKYRYQTCWKNARPEEQGDQTGLSFLNWVDIEDFTVEISNSAHFNHLFPWEVNIFQDKKIEGYINIDIRDCFPRRFTSPILADIEISAWGLIRNQQHRESVPPYLMQSSGRQADRPANKKATGQQTFMGGK